jgi:hypothetical protein
MSKITFTEEQIQMLSPEERETFNSLAAKAGATMDEDGFDVKAYLERQKQRESDDEAYRLEMENSLSGKVMPTV